MSHSGENLALTQTLSGRLRNFPLAPSPENALYGLYEAISNSIHAIRDAGRIGEDGRIDVQVERSSAGEVLGFVIEDNGVGLDEDNFGTVSV